MKGEFQVRDSQLAKYLETVQVISKNFVVFEFIHVSREQNCRADLLSKLASCTKPRQHKSIIRETLVSPPVDVGERHHVMEIHMQGERTWMAPINKYIADGQLPGDIREASQIKKSLSRYILIDGNLFHCGFSHPLLICVEKEEVTRIMIGLYEGICGSHIRGRVLCCRL